MSRPIGAEAAVEVSDLTPAEAAFLREAWNDLLARSVEPNILHGPDFLLPALEAFAGNARILVARRGDGETGRLVGVMALWRPRLGFGFLRLPTVFSSRFGPLGSPLVDADRPEETLQALLVAVSRRSSGLVFTHLPLDGAFAAVLSRAAATAGHHLDVVESHQRAVLRGAGGGEAFVHDHISRKRRKEWRRQWRRLGETGVVRTGFGRAAAARDAFADFVVLEASGWKGRERTAMVQTPEVLRFAERVVAGLAESGRVVIDRIDRSDQPLAMLVSFGVAGRWVTWKTAYDETFATYSPGAQVMLQATTRFLDEGGLIEADSLAVENHPLIDHMWPDRRRIGTLVVGFPSPRKRSLTVRLAAREIGFYMALRRFARRLRARFLG